MRGTLIFLVVCGLAALAPMMGSFRGWPTKTWFPGWPARFDTAALRQLPLTGREKAFADDFPGKIARFTDGRSEYIMRWVTVETRMLHPAADCFRAIGYDVRPLHTVTDARDRHWGCFEATREGERLRVAECIYDNAGGSWNDVSAWYWAALLGRTHGPWWAVVTARRMRP